MDKSTKQREQSHANRKAGNAAKDAKRFKDGKGSERAKAAKQKSQNFGQRTRATLRG